MKTEFPIFELVYPVAVLDTKTWKISYLNKEEYEERFGKNERLPAVNGKANQSR